MEVAERSDYVSPHVFLSEGTYHMFSDDFFKAMKPTAYFINCSRGPVVDEPALIRASPEWRDRWCGARCLRAGAGRS